jgi:glutamyl-Q tRNA(Asp) synthetase
MLQHPPVFRFAPSPNGYLHLGHAFSALLNTRLARRVGGQLLLRIEDIDTARCRPHYEAAILEDLGWLGIDFDEPVRRQSEHLADYAAVLDRLSSMGLLYPSFESRAETARLVAARECEGPWPCDPDGVPLYPGNAKGLSLAERCRRMEAGEPYALRLDMARALAAVSAAQCAPTSPLTFVETGAGPDGETGTVLADPGRWGDVVLGRKGLPTSYHLAVVIDDALQRVTHVVRGRDLFHATSLHRLLQSLLGLPQPAYHHHRLVLDADGRKLAKSNRATALRELRAAGAAPSDIFAVIDLSDGEPSPPLGGEGGRAAGTD